MPGWSHPPDRTRPQPRRPGPEPSRAAEIETAGGKVETVQKMDKKNFARVADKKNNAGFYANVIFTGSPTIVTQLRTKFALNEEVFRVLFTLAPEPKPAQ